MEALQNTKRPTGTMAQKLTADQIRQMNRDYNPQVWDKVIDRFLGYANIQFYFIPAGKYDYDRFFASYVSPSGINFFKSVSYSSMLSAGNFTELFIFTYDNEFRPHPENTIEFCITNFYIPNNTEGRDHMTQRSLKGSIFTNEGI